MDVTDEILRLGDQLRAIALMGLGYSEDKPYDADRYEQIMGVAAQLFALADTRSALEIRASVFHQLTHVTPLGGAEAAAFDEDGRLLLIRRADDGLWALPGGLINPGETPAEAAVREMHEEAGLAVEPYALIGVYDSRLCGSGATLQLYTFVVACRATGEMGDPSTPWEISGREWTAEGDRPTLSPGHHVRVPDAFAWRRENRPAYLDLP
jgi:ADP-ribose pyrophosphatase YjhB (NUDIX family)